jgi:hypothetical protein
MVKWFNLSVWLPSLAGSRGFKPHSFIILLSLNSNPQVRKWRIRFSLRGAPTPIGKNKGRAWSGNEKNLRWDSNYKSIIKWTNVHAEIWAGVLHDCKTLPIELSTTEHWFLIFIIFQSIYLFSIKLCF